MSFTVAQLDEAIENQDTDWEGSWFELEDQLQSNTSWQKVPAGTEGAHSFDGGKTFEKSLPKDPAKIFPGIGKVSLVDRYGGEGKGEDYWLVLKVIGEDGSERFFKRTGWYASYGGSELDGPTEEVTPVERPTIFWEQA